MAVVTESIQDKAQANLDEVFSMKPTARVEALRKAYLNAEATASIDRSRIETRVLRETEGEPMIARRAKVFAAIVREMPAEIYADELLACYPHAKPRSMSVSPRPALEASLEPRVKPGGLRAGLGYDAYELNDEDKREMKEELLPFWKGNGKYENTIGGRNYQQIPPELKDLIFTDPEAFPPRPTMLFSLFSVYTNGFHYGHNVVDYDRVLKKGFLGIKKDAEERLARIDAAEPEEAAKILFLCSVMVAMEAAAEIGKRFAARARELVDTEEDARRKAELLRIAEVCDWVPANPPRNFYEALQSYYFVWLLTLWEQTDTGGQSVGRIDQYLYPYYLEDIQNGRITKEEAQELIDCYLIKLNHQPTVVGCTVGGVKADGSDAANELSCMVLEGMMHTRLRQPTISVQVHNRMSDELLIKACELCSIGTGHPQFLNTDVSVSQLLARGNTGGPPVTLADARSGAPIGCSEVGIPGKEAGYLHTSNSTNLASYVELVLTNGVSRRDNRTVGVETGDPRQFESFEEVQEAFRKQLAWVTKQCQISGNINERSVLDLFPTTYESALIEGCIEKGMSREEGGAHYNFNTGSYTTGATDAGDSLAAIKRLVFDDKTITMDQLCDALEDDFEGHEDILQMCLDAPKFGNDDDYADEQVSWVHHVWVSECTKIKNSRGGSCSPGGSPMMLYASLGRAVGALPSGRLAGKPLADGHSPSPGNDRNGPTAVLNSVSKVDNVEITGGIILNMRMDPSAFKDGNMARLANLVRAFVDQKIYHMQINIVSSDTLRAAQEEPDKHQDLMVKVAGYNAFFTHLNKTLQNSIIARTEHGL